MKKYAVILLISLLCFIRPVSAGIICNDGTRSNSCNDCHQGCCSRHGGCTPEATWSEPVSEPVVSEPVSEPVYEPPAPVVEEQPIYVPEPEINSEPELPEPEAEAITQAPEDNVKTEEPTIISSDSETGITSYDDLEASDYNDYNYDDYEYNTDSDNDISGLFGTIALLGGGGYIISKHNKSKKN